MDHGFIPNLHVILLGDSQRAGAYLPYGKQLVRQLLASRQPYGKRVVAPKEGVLVEAWISGEHRWVRITAGGCPQIFMDSGAVGLQNIGLHNPTLTGQDGTLHYNTALRAYVPEEKLLGAIRPPSTGSDPSVELDASLAFAAAVGDEGNREEDSETALAYKKYCASRIPPSIFTGKLRFYFQAKYGSRLAEWKFAANTANAPPSLDWLTKLEGEDFTFQFHSAHTGIFTDARKRHWLVQLGVKGASATANMANVFLMKTTPCVEKLRAVLLDLAVSSEDKERVEAYILSQSAPDPAFCISKSVSIPLSASFGYGWHFNWSGTAADIVHVETISTGGSTYKHRSTHYRIGIQYNEAAVDDPSNTALENEDRRWSFSLEQVEQKEWKNYKWQHVIAHPDWSEQKLMIFGALLGARYGDGAPLYCYYNRDALKVVRYSCNGGGSTTYRSRSSTPAEAYGVLGWVTCTPPVVDPTALGLNGITYGDYVRSGEPVVAGFSADGTDIVGSQEAYSGTIVAYSDKVRTYADFFYNEYAPYAFDVDVGDAAAAPLVYGSGDCALTKWSWTSGGHTQAAIGPGYHEYTGWVQVEYNKTEYTRAFAETCRMLFVVPFGDAEAVYLWGDKQTTIQDSGTTYEQRLNVQELVGIHKIGGAEVAIAYNYYDPNDGGSPSTLDSYSYSADSDSVAQLGSKFLSGYGTQDFTPSSVVSAFFAGEPATHVSQQFWTRTSAGLYRDTDGDGTNLTGGYDAALTDKPYVFTGWA